MLRNVGWLRIDVSRLSIGSIFEDRVHLTPEDETTGSPETSVLNQPTLRNIPEDGRIQVNRSESLRSRTEILILELF
jgi:hypothetical protein